MFLQLNIVTVMQLQEMLDFHSLFEHIKYMCDTAAGELSVNGLLSIMSNYKQ